MAASSSTRFLIFRPPSEAAQGIGNLMNGLLATHALGTEFDRVVCVSREWQDFFAAFDVLHPSCADLPARTLHNTLWLLNFGKLPVNECQLQKRLASKSDADSVLYLVGNTYPSQWPTTTTTTATNNTLQQQRIKKLETNYRPRLELLKILPWKEPPDTVVHLRQPDDPALDPRAGLDKDTLQALGQTLPSRTYLVTNQVDYYNYFETNFGWSHPPWHGAVRHSANAKLSWGSNYNANVVSSNQQQHQQPQQRLEMWSDWWTLYHADRIFHTHSDFSLSAVHWNGIKESFSIRGVNPHTGELRFEEADLKPSTRRMILPLSQRTELQLQNCHLTPSGLDGIGYAMDLDDEYHDDRPSR